MDSHELFCDFHMTTVAQKCTQTHTTLEHTEDGGGGGGGDSLSTIQESI